MPKVAEYKKKNVEQMEKLLSEYPIVGVVNMENLPAKQLQKMREQLRGRVVLLMSKWRLMKIAFEGHKAKMPGIEQLEESLRIGMPALIFTKESPFKLARTIMANKTMAPAKPNQVAPRDIAVEAGPTGFGPGPIISELAGAGLKTKIEGGKIGIQERKVLVREGERVPKKIADVLAKLGVQPMEVGLDLLAVYDAGAIYHKDILSVSQEEYLARIRRAYSESLAVAVKISYMTRETAEIMVRNAFFESKAVAAAGKVEVDEKVVPTAQSPEPTASDHSPVDKVEGLYEELKKKGTLRQ